MSDIVERLREGGCGQYCDAEAREAADTIERLRAEVAAWKQAANEGHPKPCTLGPLCPYCEIERLRAEVAAYKRRISEAMDMAGGRWSEWGARAEMTRDILTGESSLGAIDAARREVKP